MRKYLLLCMGLITISSVAVALSSNEQLNAMRDIFINEFKKIDTNQDGKLSQDEYLNAQFESFRANIIEADGFNEKKPVKVSEDSRLSSAVADKKETVELGKIPSALTEMAEYDIDIDDISSGLTDDYLSAKEESLKDLLAQMEEENSEPLAKFTPEAIETKTDTNLPEEIGDKKSQIDMMLDVIRPTLPKKIDEITTWTDIEYKDNTIAYIYQAEIDTSLFSETEIETLNQSITTEACAKAYEEMCPKIKPMFIDEGINMRIRYFDKTHKELNSCEFNEETCK